MKPIFVLPILLLSATAWADTPDTLSDPAALRQAGAEVFGAMEELPSLLGVG